MPLRPAPLGEAAPQPSEGLRRRGLAPAPLPEAVTWDNRSDTEKEIGAAAERTRAWAPSLEGVARRLAYDDEGADSAFARARAHQSRAEELDSDVNPNVLEADSLGDVAAGVRKLAIGSGPSMIAGIGAGGLGRGMARRAAMNAERQAIAHDVSGALSRTGVPSPVARDVVGRAQAPRPGVDPRVAAAQQREAMEGLAGQAVRGDAAAMRRVDRAGNVGTMAGGTVGTLPTMVSESAEYLADADREQTIGILGHNVAAAAVGFMPYERLMGRAFANPTAQRAINQSVRQQMRAAGVQVAKQGGIQAFVEGGSEAAQAFIQRAGHRYVDQNIEMFSREAFDEYFANAVGGALLGGVMGGGMEGAMQGGQVAGAGARWTRERAGEARDAIRTRLADAADKVRMRERARQEGMPADEAPAGDASTLFRRAQDAVSEAAVRATGAGRKFREAFRRQDEDLDTAERADGVLELLDEMMEPRPDSGPMGPLFAKAGTTTQQLMLRQLNPDFVAGSREEDVLRLGRIMEKAVTGKEMSRAELNTLQVVLGNRDSGVTQQRLQQLADLGVVGGLIDIKGQARRMSRDVGPETYARQDLDPTEQAREVSREDEGAAPEGAEDVFQMPETSAAQERLAPIDRMNSIRTELRRMRDEMGDAEARSDASYTELREEGARLQGQVRADLRKNNGIVTRNDSNAKSKAFWQRTGKSAAYVDLVQPAQIELTNGGVLEQPERLDLGMLIMRQQAAIRAEGTTEEDVAPLTALLRGLSEAAQVGVDVDPNSIKVGDIVNSSTGALVMRVTPRIRAQLRNAVQAADVELEPLSGTGALIRESIRTDPDVAATARRELAQLEAMESPTKNQQQRARFLAAALEGVRAEQEMSAIVDGEETANVNPVDHGAPVNDGRKRAARVVPPGTRAGGGIDDGRFVPDASPVAAVNFDTRHDKTLNAYRRARDAASTPRAQAAAQRRAGEDIGRKELDHELEAGTISETRYKAEIKRLADPESKLADNYLRKALHGKLPGSVRVTHAKADTEAEATGKARDRDLRDADEKGSARQVAERLGQPKPNKARARAARKATAGKAAPVRKPKKAADATRNRPDLPRRADEDVSEDSMAAEDLHRQLGREGFSAAHNSPHKFDRFDWRKHSFKGEGVQAFGAGTYLSTADGVHQSYKGSFTAKVRGTPGRYNEETLRDELAEAKGERAKTEKNIEAVRAAAPGSYFRLSIDENAPMAAAAVLHRYENKRAALDAAREADSWLDGIETPAPQTTPDSEYEAFVHTADEALDDLNSSLADFGRHIKRLESELDALSKPKNTGFLNDRSPTYLVSVEATADQVLDWDKRLSEQPERVRQAVINAFNEVFGDTNFRTATSLHRRLKALRTDPEAIASHTGSAAYGVLQGAPGFNPAKASDLLQKHGLVGHKYAAAGGRNDKFPNYVIYDDGKITTNAVEFDEVPTTKKRVAKKGDDKADAAKRAEQLKETVAQEKAKQAKAQADLEQSSKAKKSEHNHQRETGFVMSVLRALGFTADQIPLMKVTNRISGGTAHGSHYYRKGEIGLADGLTGRARVEVLSHEIGHAVIAAEISRITGVPVKDLVNADGTGIRGEAWMDTLAQVNPELYAELRADYDAFRKKFGADSLHTDMRAARSGPAQAAEVRRVMREHNVADAATGEFKSAEYHLSMNEWLADHIGRALAQTKQGQSQIEKFFGDIARQIKRVYDMLFKGANADNWRAAPSVEKWVQGMFDANVSAVRAATGKAVSVAGGKAAVEAATIDAMRGGRGGDPPSGPPSDPGGDPPSNLPDKQAGFTQTMRYIRETMPPQEQKLVLRMLNTAAARKALSRYYSDFPRILRAFDNAAHGDEARIAGAFILWREGFLVGGKQSGGVFQTLVDELQKTAVGGGRTTRSVGDDLAKLFGLADTDNYVESIFQDLATGKINRLKERGGYDVRKIQARERGPRQERWNTAVRHLDSINNAVGRVFDGKGQRLRDSGVAALRRLAATLQKPQGTTGEDPGYVPSVRNNFARYTTRLRKVHNNLNPRESVRAFTLLQRGVTDLSKESFEVRQAAEQTRRVLDDLYGYMKDAGVKVGKRENFFPVMMEVSRPQDQEKLRTLLSDPDYEQPIRELFAAFQKDRAQRDGEQAKAAGRPAKKQVPPLKPEHEAFFQRERDRLHERWKRADEPNQETIERLIEVNEKVVEAMRTGNISTIEKHIAAAEKRLARYEGRDSDAAEAAVQTITNEIKLARARIKQINEAPDAPAGADAPGAVDPETGDISEMIDNMVKGAAPATEYTPSFAPDSPTFRGQRYRSMQFIYDALEAARAAGDTAAVAKHEKNVATFASLQTKDPAALLTRYVEPAIKRAEYARRFGDDGAKLEKLMEQAKAQGATPAQLIEARDTVKAAIGTYGAEGSPTLAALSPDLSKKFSGPRTRGFIRNVQAYQNVRLLPLATLTSLVDPTGIAVRSGGEVGMAWDAYKTGIRGIFDKATRAEQEAALEILGQADDMFAEVAIHQPTDTDMSKVSTANRVNNWLFRVNLLQGYTKATRFMGLEAAHQFILKHDAGANERSELYMRELGLRPGDVKSVYGVSSYSNGAANMVPKVDVLTEVDREALRDAAKGGDARAKAEATAELARDERVRNALMQFVDEAILRPNPMQTPMWMSDPYMGLVSQYKAFAYALYDQIYRRSSIEADRGNPRAFASMLLYVPAMLGAEVLRELIQNLGRDERRKDWGMMEYTALAAERTGLYSPRFDAARTAFEDTQRRNLPLTSHTGPTAGQARDVYRAFTGRRSVTEEAQRAAPFAAVHRRWDENVAQAAQKRRDRRDDPEEQDVKQMALEAAGR